MLTPVRPAQGKHKVLRRRLRREMTSNLDSIAAAIAGLLYHVHGRPRRRSLWTGIDGRAKRQEDWRWQRRRRTRA